MTNNPNAIVALISGLIASGVVWLLHTYTGVDLSTSQAALIATGFSALILYIGRNGLRNSVGRLWWGSQSEPSE